MICPDCSREIGKHYGDYCPFCGADLKESSDAQFSQKEPSSNASAPSASGTSEPGEGPPWENSQLPFFERLFATARESMFNPVNFFRGMRKFGGYGNPLLYALIFGTVGGIAGYIWNTLFQSIGIFARQKAKPAIPLALVTIISIFLMPLFVIIGTFIGAGIGHLCLMIFGAANETFETTYRVICYSYAPNLFQIIPFGGIIAGIWILVMEIIGLKEAHRTEYWRVILAIIAPTILLLLCCCGLIMALIIPALTKIR